MAERHDITDNVIGPNGSELHRKLGGRGMPLTAFYDAEGTLVHVDRGALVGGAIFQRVEQVFGILA